MSRTDHEAANRFADWLSPTKYGPDVCNLGRAYLAKEAALKDMFAMIDEGFLVRNTQADGDSGWGARVLQFVMRLQKAHAALSEASQNE